MTLDITNITDGLADNLTDSIKAHMNDQPYYIRCSNCGRELKVDVTVDPDFDLILIVEPCEYCVDSECKVAFINGKEAGYEDGLEDGKQEGYQAGLNDCECDEE